MSEEKERLFLAFWPDQALRERVAVLAGPAVRKARARPVPADNLHVTLVFIGSWPVAERGRIEGVLEQMPVPGGDIVLNRIVHWRRPRILALAADDSPEAVLAYQRQLSAAMATLGWLPEERSWRPHVTIGRKTGRGVRKKLEEPIAWPCDRVALVRSENGATGSLYHPLRIWERAGA